MFESLSDRLTETIRKFKGQTRITEAHLEETLKELRLGLLEADVNFKVVKSFVDQVKQKALGQEVLKGLEPRQQFLKIVHDELTHILGHQAVELQIKSQPSYLMLVGLQGSGKTTSAAKLALWIRQKLKKNVGLVPLDLQRPAAIEQLKILGKSNQIPVFPTEPDMQPVEVAKRALAWGKNEALEVLIFDTAGRQQVDEHLMQELVSLKGIIQPHEVLLVVDSHLGQQSVSVAQGFHERLGLTGLVLTKVDGDARGGAALSIRYMTGVPIKFFGTGEKVSALEVFHPDRIASRLLDLGDIATLVENASQLIDQKESEKTSQKMVQGQFTLEDFLKQMQMLKKMGGLESLLKFLPGFGELKKQLGSLSLPEKELKKVEAMILSMTPEERRRPEILNASRRQRIAKGSGTQVQDINRLVQQFETMKKMMGSFLRGQIPGGAMPKSAPPPKYPSNPFRGPRGR
jgi:signal recognition particle subunit SRP54